MNGVNIVVAAQVQDAVRGLDRVTQSTQRVGKEIDRASAKLKQHSGAYNRTAVATNKWAKGALQQAGYQVGDFAVQVANGTNKLQAFGQQAPQLLQIFGPIGAVVGAGVAVFAALGVIASKAGDDVGKLTSALGVLEAPAKAAAAAVGGLRDTLGSAANIMLQNIDTAIIALGLFAGVAGVKYVAAAIKASGASGILAAAMVNVRAAVIAATITTGRFSTVLVGARTATLLLGASVRALGAVLMRFLPIAVLLGVAKLIEMFLQLMKGAEGFGNAMKLLGDLFSAAFTYMVGSTEGFKLQFDKIVAQVKVAWLTVITEMQKRYMMFLDGIANATQDIPFLSGFTEQINEAANTAAASWMGLEAQITAAEQAVKNAQDKISKGNEAALQKLKDAWEALKGAFGKGKTEIEGISFATTKAAKDGGDALTELQQRTLEISNSIRTNMTSAFMSMVDGTKTVQDAFKDMARSIIAKLYEVLVVQRIVNAALGIFGFSQNDKGQFVNWSNPFAGKRAMGGPVTGGQPYLVGENGPEIVVPSRNASVIPNNQIGGGGQVIVNQTINVSTGVQQTVRAEIRTLMPQIADAAKSAVVDAKRRGGSFGRAFS